ncbi:aldolase [Georgenia sp. EYE_87]|uniref:class II aldolase/adducin family protein n=1 Tax=Georgenia sp. EYE_87 TaxID=2853448 RepID=UPI002005ED8F|nr:aldolase [Georgenia sp. EYE_87]MCK6210132.1 aldolase [Georgenia sp. EYE_87]
MTDAVSGIVEVGRSLFARRLTPGRTGNISVRVDDTVYLTASGASLGSLTREDICLVDLRSGDVQGPPPTKEAFLHEAIYRVRPDAGAVVHLHSTYAVAVSCLRHADPSDVLPPLTAYYTMRVGRLPLVPYHAPGDRAVAGLVRELAADNHALLLANHGPVVAGTDLASATDAVEELEETARLFFLLEARDVSLVPRPGDRVTPGDPGRR